SGRGRPQRERTMKGQRPGKSASRSATRDPCAKLMEKGYFRELKTSSSEDVAASGAAMGFEARTPGGSREGSLSSPFDAGTARDGGPAWLDCAGPFSFGADARTGTGEA